MTLIASISGIRGTLGTRSGEGLTPNDVLRYVVAFGAWLQSEGKEGGAVVIGRDARRSGIWCSQLTAATLQAMGFLVLDTGLSTTPSTQMEVLNTEAVGGIIVTASHNPIEWNALKLLNHEGECLNSRAAHQIQELAHESDVCFADYRHQGNYERVYDAMHRHVDAVLALPLVDTEAVRKQKWRVAIDATNSTGGMVLKPLLKAMGIEVTSLNATPTGLFVHPPEPLPEHLGELSECVIEQKMDLGLAVDPDVDRLAVIDERGAAFGEEYTLVAVADYVLEHTPGACVSNASSSRALQEVAARHNVSYSRSAVGEAYVVEEMRRVGAVIGGEGNGGVIYPTLHAGRDAVLAAALFLSHLAQRSVPASELRRSYPSYHMGKYRFPLSDRDKVDAILGRVSASYTDQQTDRIDGLRIDFEDGWAHLRPSNTEPILRLYIEAETSERLTSIYEAIQKQVQ